MQLKLNTILKNNYLPAKCSLYFKLTSDLMIFMK